VLGTNGPAENDTHLIDVPMISGTRLFEQSGLDRLDVIKIDVEGYEETVLASLADTIRLQKPRVVLFEHQKDLNDPNSPIRSIFDSCGYRIQAIHKSLTGHSFVPVESLAIKGIRAND